MSQKFQYIVDFLANTEKFQKEIGGLKGTLKAVGVAAAAYFSTDAIVSFARSSAEAYNDSIQSETALLTALKGRKDVQEGLIDQASDLMSKTLFDDDEIVRAQSLVAAFVKEEDKIKTLIPLIQDFATAKQMDLAGAADLVTKTLAGEMNALGRYGIKVEGAAGSSERLAMITKGLNDAFGGQAEAAAKVGTAALVQLSNEYGNLKEEIGKLIIAQENQQGSFTKMMTEHTRSISEFLAKINELNEVGSDTTNSVLIQLMVRAGFISQAAVDARIAFGKAQNDLMSAMDSSLESSNTKPQTEQAKQYANSIEGLTEKLKDYNDELKLIAPNDTKAITAKLQQINAVERQIKSIDELKTKLEAMNAMSLDPLRGQKLTMILPTWTRDETVGKSVTGGKKDTQDVYSSSYSSKKYSFLSNGINTKELDFSIDKTKELNAAIVETMTVNEQVDNLAASFGLLGNSIGGVGGNFLTMAGNILGMIPTLIAQVEALSAVEVAGSTAVTAAKSSEAIVSGVAASQKVPFPLNIIALAATIAAVGGAIASATKFADGGIVFGPTLGLMGEYPGARSNPEIIAPLSKLKEMIGDSKGSPTIILQPSLEFGYDGLRIRLEQHQQNIRKRT